MDPWLCNLSPRHVPPCTGCTLATGPLIWKDHSDLGPLAFEKATDMGLKAVSQWELTEGPSIPQQMQGSLEGPGLPGWLPGTHCEDKETES